MADPKKMDELLEKMKNDSKVRDLAKDDPAKALESVGVKVAPDAIVSYQTPRGRGGRGCYTRGAPVAGCFDWGDP